MLDLALEALVADTRVSVGQALAQEPLVYGTGCLQDMLLSMFVYDLSRSGEIELGRCIGHYLPELNAGHAPGETVRVADLLCHSSGLKAPRPHAAGAIYADWDSFSAYLVGQEPVFPAGRVVNYDLVERILLVHLLRRHLALDPHKLIEERLLQGLNAHFRPLEASPRLGLCELVTDTANLLDLCKRLTAHRSGWFAHACSMPALGSALVFESGEVGKAFVPQVYSHGLLGFGHGLWGQNGTAENRYVAVRIDPSGDVVVGAFRAQHERDMIMNAIWDWLGRSGNAELHSKQIGCLRGFDPQALAGEYDSGATGRFAISCRDGELTIHGSGGGLRCKIGDDGALTSRFALPGFWIEPFAHPVSGRECIKIGLAASVRL